MELKRIKVIGSHTGVARFFAEASEESIGSIAARPEIPSPYRYSPEWAVWEWQGRKVVIVEVAHRRYEVFEVPAELVMKEAA